MKKEEGRGSLRGMGQVCPSLQQSGEALQPRAEYQVPLDDTLMATADDFLLLVLVLPVELELEAEPVAEGLQETAICPEICKKRV